MNPAVLLVFDEGPGIGLGHRRRMEVLAGALRRRDVDADTAPLVDRVDADVVVVDSYRVRADDHGRVAARRVAAIDDLDRALAVDLLVEPSPPCRKPADTGAPTARRVLAGFEYALVDPDLRRWRDAEPRSDVEEVLVATGGADGAGIGADIAAGVAAALPGARVRLVVGPWSAPDVPPGVEPVMNPPGLGEHLASADLVVCSAGVTALEALAAGRPVVAVRTASNQQRTFDALVSGGAAVGARVATAAEEAAALAADGPRRRQLAATGAATIDGLGAERVADAVLALA